MLRKQQQQSRNQGLLKDRVAHAYFMYGRFCSSHPYMCMVFSICSVLLLSYPLHKIQLPSASPLDVHWEEENQGRAEENKPDWLSSSNPHMYIQQILVESRIDPWDISLIQTAENGVKGCLKSAFVLNQILNKYQSNGIMLDQFCLQVSVSPAEDLLPTSNCLKLSPTLFWQDNINDFVSDGKLLHTIFSQTCTNSMCIRDLLFGLPTRMSGVKPVYRTKRQRSVKFAFTLVLRKHYKEYWTSLKGQLNSTSEFKVKSGDDGKFVHIFYRSRKELKEYVPLAASYIFLLIYVYFSVSKIEMVKCKWGLAVSAVITIASSLFMAAGICLQFDLTPTTWGAELFPYIAMTVGFENTLCITRSVVWTPVNLEVRSRIAHGLSKEGWSITKNFLAELLIITIGFFTFLPEIQEFCIFACIGLVVDFYMQLFFYAPCLTFDLLRLEHEDKNPIQRRQLTGSPPELSIFPPTRCPVVAAFPQYFRESGGTERKLHRVKSDPRLELTERKSDFIKTHRKALSHTSNISLEMDSRQSRRVLKVLPEHVPRRLRVLYFWTNTRFVQRMLMFMTVMWIVWLAFIVHEFHLIGQLPKELNAEKVGKSSKEAYYGGLPESKLAWNFKGKHDSAPLDWSFWQRKTFNWWPVLFDQYNISLSGQYLTVLPPILLAATISPDDSVFKHLRKEETASTEEMQGIPGTTTGEKEKERVGGLSFFPQTDWWENKIFWLELQMKIVLFMSFGIFAVVAVFILYVIFGGRGSCKTCNENSEKTGKHLKRGHTMMGSKAMIDCIPLRFEGHTQDIECVSKLGKDFIVSTCLGGSIRLWDAKTGECLKTFTRHSNEALNPRSENHTYSNSSADQNLIQQEVSMTNQNTVNGELRNRYHNRNGRSTFNNHQNQPDLHFNFSAFFGNSYPQNSGVIQSMMFLDFDNQLRDNNSPPIWCLAAQNNMVAVGCSNGTVELYSVNGKFICSHSPSQHLIEEEGLLGVNQICMQGSRLVLARLNGILEFVEFKLTQPQQHSRESHSESPKIRCHVISTVRAHQHPINCMKMTPPHWLITGSSDHTIKLFDLRTCRPVSTLYGHNGAVMSLCIDNQMQVLYSSCDEGLVCAWNLLEGRLINSFEEAMSTGSFLALGITQSMLLAQSSDGHLWIWNTESGEFVTRLKRETPSASDSKSILRGGNRKEKLRKSFSLETYEIKSSEAPVLVIIEGSDDFAVTVSSGYLQIWSLTYKILLRELKLESQGGSIQKLLVVDSEIPSVICSKGKMLFRVNFPFIKLK